MNYNNPIPKKTVGIIRYSCGLLFSVFCFCFLAFLRGDVLAGVQYRLSGGLTTYSLLIGALIITFLLQLLQWVVELFVRVPERLHFLTYVPSFIFLSVLIDIDQNVDGGLLWGAWQWLLPLLLAVWAFAVFFVMNLDNADDAMRLRRFTNISGPTIYVCW